MDWTNVAAGAAQWIPNKSEPDVDPNELAFHKAMARRSGQDIPDDVIIQAIKQRDNPDAAQWSTPQAYSSQTVGGTKSETFGPPTGQPDVSAMGNYKAKYSPEQFAQLLQDIQNKQSSRSPAQRVGNVAAGFFGGFRGLESAKQMDKDRANQEFGDLWRFKEQSAYGEEMGRRGREEEARQEAKITAAQLKDPNSAQSKSAYEAISVLVSTDPAMAERIANIPEDQRTAVQLLAAFPAYKEAIKNAIELEKNRETVRGRIQASEDRSADRESQNATMLAIAGMPSRTNVGKPGTGASEQEPTEYQDDNITPKISGIKTDRFGNRVIDPTIAKNLAPKAKAAEQAELFMEQIEKLETDKTIEQASQSGIGKMYGGVQTFIGYGDTGKANKALEQFANGALGVLDSPLMKGAPSEADARRALSQINDPEAPLEVKQQAMATFKRAVQDAMDDLKATLLQYDKETLRHLAGLGIKELKDKPKLEITDADRALAKKSGYTPEEIAQERANAAAGK